jgi:hypothetical protein
MAVAQRNRMLQVFNLLNGVTVETVCCSAAIRVMDNGFVRFFGSRPSQDMQLLQMGCDRLGQSHSHGRTRTFWRSWRSGAVILAGLNYALLLGFDERITANCQKPG